MNCRLASFAFALPVSLALACTACGHGNQNHANEPAPNATVSNPAMQPAPAHTAPNPNMAPLPNATTRARGEPGSDTTLGPKGTGQAVDFGMLAGSKGYITPTDAMRNPWMNRHFAECDSNHDGKVTHAEFDACRKAVEPVTGATAG